MKIKEISLTEEAYEDRDYRDALEIEVDGVSLFRFFDGCPEDNSIARNFSDVQSITGAMKLAYEAGKRGEVFEVDSEKVDEF